MTISNPSKDMFVGAVVVIVAIVLTVGMNLIGVMLGEGILFGFRDIGEIMIFVFSVAYVSSHTRGLLE